MAEDRRRDTTGNRGPMTGGLDTDGWMAGDRTELGTSRGRVWSLEEPVSEGWSRGLRPDRLEAAAFRTLTRSAEAATCSLSPLRPWSGPGLRLGLQRRPSSGGPLAGHWFETRPSFCWRCLQTQTQPRSPGLPRPALAALQTPLAPDSGRCW